MKRFFLASVAMSLAMYVGCGGGSTPTGTPSTNNQTSTAPAATSTSNSVGANSSLSLPALPPVMNSPAQAGSVAGNVVLPEDPKEIVRVFMDAMRSGNGEQLTALFSSAARAEIEKQGMRIEPPGTSQARFEVEDAAPHNDAMLVSSKWIEPPTVEGEEALESEVLWELRKELGGWRICGMAFDPGTGEELQVVNFENLAAPGVSPLAEPATRVASLPEGASAAPSLPPMPSLPPLPPLDAPAQQAPTTQAPSFPATDFPPLPPLGQ